MPSDQADQEERRASARELAEALLQQLSGGEYVDYWWGRVEDWKYLDAEMASDLVTALFRALFLTDFPPQTQGYMWGNEVVFLVSLFGRSFEPDIPALFEIYCLRHTEIAPARAEWYATKDDSLIFFRTEHLATSWQLAWTISRADMSVALPQLKRFESSTKELERSAVADLIEDVVRYSTLDVPPQFGGGTGPPDVAMKPKGNVGVKAAVEEIFERYPLAGAEEFGAIASTEDYNDSPPPLEPLEESGDDPSPPPAPRHLNVDFVGEDRETPLPRDRALAPGAAQLLRVEIAVEHAGLGEPGEIFPERALRHVWREQESLPLTVIVDSQDFAVAERMQTLALPRAGDSIPVFFVVTAPAAVGPAYLVVEVFHRGFLLQSKLVKAIVGTAQAAAGESLLNARVSFTTAKKIDPESIDVLPDRPLTIEVERHPDKPTVQLRFLDRTHAGEETPLYRSRAPLAPEALGHAVDGVRNVLRLMVTGDPGGGDTGYEWILDGDDPLLSAWLPRLAEVGRALYRQLLPDFDAKTEDQGEQLKARLRPDTVIQVNMVLGPVTLPWALLYERRVMRIPNQTVVCPNVDSAGPECQGCPNADDPRHVCPNAFWGYRYVIEQMSCWASDRNPVAPPRLAVIRNDSALNLNFNVWRKFLMWRDHLTEIKAAGEVALQPAEDLATLAGLCAKNAGEIDLVYFYSHGGVDPGHQPYLEISDGYVNSTFLDAALPGPNAYTRNPLVLLNGCATGDYGPESYISLIDEFRHYGASGVIGTECEVPEQFAEVYAAKLLPRVFKGDPVGPAMLAVRRELLKERRNPLGLLYTLYAPSEICLATPVA